MRPDKQHKVEKAHVLLQRQTTRAMGPGKILLCNNAADTPRFIKHCDAVMYEHHKPDQYRENLQRYVDDWEQMRAVANAGKINVYRWGVNLDGTRFKELGSRERAQEEHHAELSAIARERISFPLACFLMGAQPYSYFMLSWGWGLYTGALVEFPELNKPLGPPHGPYHRPLADRWIFARHFQHADVWVDLEKEQGIIQWHE